MMAYNFIMKVNDVPGYFKEIWLKEHESGYFKGKVDSLHGVICLHPNIRERYINHWLHGHVELDLFFRVYVEEKIDRILKLPKKKPLLFSGTIERRYEASKFLYEDLSFSLETVNFVEDKTRGKLSPSRAILLSSSDSELVIK